MTHQRSLGLICGKLISLPSNKKKARGNSKHNHSRLPCSFHSAWAALSDKLTHGSGLKSSYYMWGCGLIIPVTGHVEQVVPKGWRMKQRADGFGETVEENSENTVLVFKVSATESPISSMWKKTPHTFHLWNSTKVWRFKTLDMQQVVLKKCNFQIQWFPFLWCAV